MSPWSATSAHLVEQSTNDPKFEGLNTATPGTEQKWQLCSAAVVQLVEQSSNYLKFEGSNPGTAGNGEKGKKNMSTWSEVLTQGVQQ